MYLILIIILLILLSWLVIAALKPTAKGIKALYPLIGIFVLAVGSLWIYSYHYKEINPPALILALMITVVLILCYTIRRLH